MKPEVELEKVTPKMAMQYLGTISNNRPVSQDWVRHLVKMMKDGGFLMNAETIKFDKKGRLFDGQHRLQAIVNSGVACEIMVARGLDESTYLTVDVGKRRTGADALYVAGEKAYPKLMAAALRAIIIYNVFGHHDATKGLVTNLDLIEELPKHPKLHIWCERAKRLNHLIESALAAPYFYLMAKKDEGAALEFFEKLETGIGLEDGSPILLLRDKLAANRSSRARLPRKEVAALLIKAWNDYRKGRTIKRLLWTQDREDFPKIA